ncbi:histidine kinase, partial [Streptomyces sp. BE133]|nr:histidine kinase [Streptomyces sp. BE133]
ASTAQFARPAFGQPQPARAQDQDLSAPLQRGRDHGAFGAPRPPAVPHGDAQSRPVLPPQPQSEALPPAGPGDGRTPQYDTLETNWFHGPQQGGQQPPAEPQAHGFPQQSAPERPAPAAPRRGGGDTGATTSSWRP